MKSVHIVLIGVAVVIAAVAAFVVIDQFTGEVKVESVQDDDSRIGEFSFVDGNGGKSGIRVGAKLSNPVTIMYTGESRTWTDCSINEDSVFVVFSAIIDGNPADFVFQFDGVEGKDLSVSLDGGVPSVTFTSSKSLGINLMYFDSKGGEDVGRYYFSAYERGVPDNVILPAYYSDSFFDSDARELNFDLMTFALTLEMSSGYVTDDYRNRSASVLKLLNDIGCTKVKANADYYAETDLNSTDAAIGLKQIDGYNVIFLVLNGAKYEREFASNFLVGETGEHEGFANAKNKGLELLRGFIEENNITGKTKLLVTGHSRTGAATNLLGAYICDAIHDGKVKERVGNIELEQKDAYFFCSEPPLGGYYEPDKGLVSPTDPRYDNIWYILNPDDMVTFLPSQIYGFVRYGQCYTLPVTDKDKATRALDLIESYANQDRKHYDMSRFNRISDVSRMADINKVFIDKLFSKLGTREFYYEDIENELVRASYVLLSKVGLFTDIVNEYGGYMSLVTSMYVQSTSYEGFMEHFRPYVLKVTEKYDSTEYAENIINTGYQVVEVLKRYSNNSMMNIITDKYILALFANTGLLLVPHSPLTSMCYLLQECSYSPLS